MQGYGTAFGLGLVAGMRSLSACAALTWAAADGRTRGVPIPAGAGARALATTAALAEMVGDKMPFAPDRRIPPSFAFRLVIGAAGGWALTGRHGRPAHGALAGLAGAVAGTLLGRAARGADSRTGPGRSRGLAEDVIAASLAAAIAVSTDRSRSG